MAVFDDLNLPDISLKFSPRNARGLAAVSTQILRFSTLAEAVPSPWLQITVQLKLLRPFDSLVFFECTHDLNSVPGCSFHSR